MPPPAQNKFQSDFYTSDEMAKFKKPLGDESPATVLGIGLTAVRPTKKPAKKKSRAKVSPSLEIRHTARTLQMLA